MASETVQSDHRAPGILTAVIPGLALVAGVIHLVHNYLPMGMPSGAAAGPAPGAPMNAAPSGLMGLTMSHLSEVMLLNFMAFAGLAVVFVLTNRLNSRLRVWVDALLVLMSGATLYVWNAMGRSNPYGTGTLALAVELALILFTVVHAGATLSSSNGPVKRGVELSSAAVD